MIEENTKNNNEISSRIESRLSSDEIIVYFLKYTHRERQSLDQKILTIILYIVYIFVIVFLLIILIDLVNKGYSIYSGYNLLIMFFLGLFILIVIFIQRTSRDIRNYELVLTNKKLCLRTTNKYNIEQGYVEIVLNSIVALGFKKSYRLLKYKALLKDLVVIIKEKHDLCEIIKIYDILNIDILQNKIESILWYIGEKCDRWKQLKTKEDIESNRAFKWNDKELKYYNNTLNIKERNKEKSILFKDVINFKFSQKNQQCYILSYPLVAPKIKIGPFDTYIMELVYLIYLNWKNYQKLLISREQLLKEKENRIISSELKRDLILKPIDKSNLDLQKLNKFLIVNEYILIHYKPIFKLRKSLIKIYLGIGALILLIIQMIFASFLIVFISFGFMIVSIIICIFLMMSCIFPMLTFSIRKNINKTEYFFTNKKIIIFVQEEKIIVEFDNISTVWTDEDKTSNFVLINLIKPMKIGYEEEETEIPIIISPKKKEITEKIYTLIKKNIKSQ